MQFTRKHALVLIMGVTMIFLAVPAPHNETERKLMMISPFLTDDTCTLQEYIYHFGEHLAWLSVCVIMVLDAPKRVKFYAKAFLVLNAIDFLDFLISYNNLTVPFGKLNLSWNIIQFAILLVIVWFKRDDD